MSVFNSRRRFIKQFGTGMLGGAAFANGLLPLMANAQTNVSSDYKALICINLRGGNDGFNTIIPTSASGYDTYLNARPNIAVPQDFIIPISSLTAQSDSYGLHGVMADMANLYDQGRLAIIGNVGNLVEPVTKAGYFDGTSRLPPHLFSHNDQTAFLHTLNGKNTSSGWGGRIAEALSSYNINQQLAMNITLSGDNQFQRGNTILPYSVKSSGVNIIDALSATQSASRADLYRRFLNKNRNHVLQNYHANIQLNSWGLAQYVSDVLVSQTPHNLPYLNGGGQLMQSLSMISNIMLAHDAFELKRQIFYVDLGSFDTHRNQVEVQDGLLFELNRSLKELYQLLEQVGMADQVTTFTTAEFGRTLTMNGNDGTDHGWTNHHFVMGGAVKGNQIIGQMPSLEIEGDNDLGEGRLIPDLSFDQYAATLARWFGVGSDDISAMFPNLANFNQNNLGFMI